MINKIDRMYRDIIIVRTERGYEPLRFSDTVKVLYILFWITVMYSHPTFCKLFGGIVKKTLPAKER